MTRVAFFSLDGKVQALLIAGAIASAACGSDSDLVGDGGTDGDADVADTADTADTAGDDMPWLDVDPPPDVLDVDAIDSPDGDATGLCPDPSAPTVSFAEASTGFPTSTLRATLDVAPELLVASSPVFTAEKGTILEVRRVSAAEYEIDYRWDYAAPVWSDWDRIHVTWTIRCEGAGSDFERAIAGETVVCVMSSGMWLSWDLDPESCMMADPPPPPYRPGEWMDARADAEGVGMHPLPRGALRTGIDAVTGPDGRMRLTASTTGPAARSATFEWKVSAGTIEAWGREAVWTPPAVPGMHAVLVVVRSGIAVSVEVLRVLVNGSGR